MNTKQYLLLLVLSTSALAVHVNNKVKREPGFDADLKDLDSADQEEVLANQPSTEEVKAEKAYDELATKIEHEKDAEHDAWVQKEDDIAAKSASRQEVLMREELFDEEREQAHAENEYIKDSDSQEDEEEKPDNTQFLSDVKNAVAAAKDAQKAVKKFHSMLTAIIPNLSQADLSDEKLSNKLEAASNKIGFATKFIGEESYAISKEFSAAIEKLAPESFLQVHDDHEEEDVFGPDSDSDKAARHSFVENARATERRIEDAEDYDRRVANADAENRRQMAEKFEAEKEFSDGELSDLQHDTTVDEQAFAQLIAETPSNYDE